MTVNRAVGVFAGPMVITSLALAHFTGQVDLSRPSWPWLTAFVGLNLYQMGYTGFCPAAVNVKALGAEHTEGGAACRS